MPRLGVGALVTRDAFLRMRGDPENQPEFTTVRLVAGADPAAVIAANPDGFPDASQTATTWFTDTKPAELRQLDAARTYLVGALRRRIRDPRGGLRPRALDAGPRQPSRPRGVASHRVHPPPARRDHRVAGGSVRRRRRRARDSARDRHRALLVPAVRAVARGRRRRIHLGRVGRGVDRSPCSSPPGSPTSLRSRAPAGVTPPQSCGKPDREQDFGCPDVRCDRGHTQPMADHEADDADSLDDTDERRGRGLLIGIGAVLAVVAIAVVVYLVARDDDGDSTAPAVTTTTTTTSPGTTSAPATSLPVDTSTAVWPSPSSTTRYADPVSAAARVRDRLRRLRRSRRRRVQPG